MNRIMGALAVVALLIPTTACSGGRGSKSTTATTAPPSAARTQARQAATTVPQSALSRPTGPTAPDAALILSMYADITEAFQHNPDEGVRALIAAQYPGDLADVEFARCVNAIVPGAKTLPPTEKLHFVPNIATTTPDPGYALTSNRVKGLHPKGRIYVTDVTISGATRPTVRERHQVVLDGKAYQFSAC